jgi:osmotically-inducible protein OsmY
VKTFAPEIDVNDGEVILRGIVDNLQAKKAAGEDARNVVGVWRVRNHLKVRPSTDEEDVRLADKVKEALSRDPYVEAYDIVVGADNGEVTLMGVVDSRSLKERSVWIAARTSGVLDVDDRLKVSGEVPGIMRARNDWALKQDIEKELAWNARIDEDDITVSVEDGMVTLSGKVDTWSERMAAQASAGEAGAEKIRNRLEVEHGPEVYRPDSGH